MFNQTTADVIRENTTLMATVAALKLALTESLLSAEQALTSTTAGDDLLAQLAEARKDTERLKYLIATGYQHNSEFRMFATRAETSCYSKWESVESCIDAAISQTESKQ